MGESRHSHRNRRQKRLKPSFQQLFYHARQPILTLTAGSLIALAINFSVGQVRLSPDTPNSPHSTTASADTSSPTILDAFDIKTDSSKKEVQVILHRQTGSNHNRSFDVSTAQKGNQFTLTMENTQLSQQMVDSGLPVVIDNQNKLIGRAVPGKTVNQSKIIIPNLPSQDNYQVLVYEQTPGHSQRLLNDDEQPSTAIATSRPMPAYQPPKTQTLAPIAKPALEKPKAAPTSIAKTPAPKPKAQAIASQPSFSAPQQSPAIEKPSLLSQIFAPAGPRLEKTELPPIKTAKPKPRSAVPGIESRFDTIASNALTDTPPLANGYQQESFALASIAKNPKPVAAPEAPKAKRPIQIVESRSVASNELDIRPKQLAPLSTTSSEMTAETLTQPALTNNGSITYVPSFSSKGRSGFQHGPLWNPYVVKEIPAEEPAQSTPLSKLPPFQTASIPDSQLGSTPSPDPLWYLHNLPGGSANNNGVALQAVPNLSNGAAVSSANPTLSAAPTESPLASGSILIDNRFINTLSQALLNLPVWFYVIFALFFGGIGLFTTFGALFLLQQFWLNTKRTTVIQTVAAPAVQEEKKPAPIAPPVEPESIQFKDSANIQLQQYLLQNPIRDQQQTIKHAVKKSVLLHFPSQRAGNKAKPGQPSRKVSHMLL